MTSILTIDGMRSVHCTRAVFTALGAIEGVKSAEVEIGRAVIEHDGKATAERIQDALDVVGYRLVAVESGPRRLPLVHDDP